MDEMYGPIVDLHRDMPKLSTRIELLESDGYVKAGEIGDKIRYVSTKYLMDLPARTPWPTSDQIMARVLADE